MDQDETVGLALAKARNGHVASDTKGMLIWVQLGVAHNDRVRTVSYPAIRWVSSRYPGGLASGDA